MTHRTHLRVGLAIAIAQLVIAIVFAVRGDFVMAAGFAALGLIGGVMNVVGLRRERAS